MKTATGRVETVEDPYGNPDEEAERRNELVRVNDQELTREALMVKYEEVMNSQEVAEKYDVVAFLAPFVGVTRKSDGKKGTLQFCHQPRFYFNFQAE